MTGNAKRGKTPADKAQRLPMSASAFVTLVQAWAQGTEPHGLGKQTKVTR